MRARAGAVLGTAALGAGLLAGSAAPWLTADASTPIARDVLAVQGSAVAPSVPAGGLVLLAAALALALAGRLARLVVAVVVTGVGVLVAVTATTFLLDPGPAAAVAVAAETGVRGAQVAPDVTVWPVVVAALGGLAAVVGGVVAALSGRRWTPGTSHRYEANDRAGRAGTGASSSVGARATEDWDALTRGEDPS